jgi:hypothetical protein
MGACDPNKWTCPRPGCKTTVTVTDRNTHATIARLQESLSRQLEAQYRRERERHRFLTDP